MRSTARRSPRATVLRWLRAVMLPLVAAIPLAACDGSRTDFARVNDDATVEALDSVTLLDPVDDAATSSEPGADAPDELYYDLTAFDWYRRGEPLLVEGRAYAMAGRPEATGPRRFERVGEYQGVAYYVEQDAQEPYAVVYVPVYPGYWLPFAAQEPEPRPAE